MAKTPEGKIKDIVKKKLKEAGVYYFMPVQNGMGAPALDFFVCYKGLFIGIETKAPSKTPTPRQRLTMEEIRNSRGWCAVIDSEQAAEGILEQLKVARVLLSSGGYDGDSV